MTFITYAAASFSHGRGIFSIEEDSAQMGLEDAGYDNTT